MRGKNQGLPLNQQCKEWLPIVGVQSKETFVIGKHGGLGMIDYVRVTYEKGEEKKKSYQVIPMPNMRLTFKGFRIGGS